MWAADSASLSILGDLTIECWIKFESIGADTKGIVGKAISAGNQRAYSFYYNEATDTLNLDVSDDGISSDTHTSNAMSFAVNIWYPVAVTFDASAATSIFYKNGVAAGGETETMTAIADTTAVFQIGARDTTKFWDGKIDEVRVYNDIRTPAEIAANAGREQGTGNNLQGYWKLNNALTDASGNSNTLTNSGAAAFSTDTPFTHFQENLTVAESLTVTPISWNITLTENISVKDVQRKWKNTDKSTAPSWSNKNKTTPYDI